jgi:hypothetical protein
MSAGEGDQPAHPPLIQVRLGENYYWALSRARTAAVILLTLLFTSSLGLSCRWVGCGCLKWRKCS